MKLGKQLNVLHLQHDVASFFMIHSTMCCTSCNSHYWEDMLNKEIWQEVFGKYNVYMIFCKINSNLFSKHYSYCHQHILY